MAKSTSPFFDTATTLGKIVAFLGVSALCGVLVAGLMMPLAAVGGAVASSGQEVFDQLPAELTEEPMSVPSRIVAEDGTELARFYAENRVPVSLDEISPNMQNAIISIEDERFYEHSGVDARGLARAMVNNVASSSQQGASTLTQQYVNNVLVNYQSLNNLRTTISGTKSAADKLREMKLAVAVEKEMSKEEILEGYLNIVLFSGRIYGVEAASRYFFNKPSSELTVPEAALLAGMVQSPNGYNPVNNPEGARDRRDVVLAAMLRNEKITQEEYEQAKATDIVLDVTPVGSGCISAELGAYFCDYVQRIIQQDEAFGPDPESRQRLLDRGGLVIRTTLDTTLQREAETTVKENAPYTEFEGRLPSGQEATGQLGGALVTVEPGTGNIRAMAQNTDYDVDGTEGNTTLNFNVDAAMGGGSGFQAGSTMKPFTFLSWIESGHSMTDTLDARINRYPQWTEFEASCREDGKSWVVSEDGWTVRNAIANMNKPMRADYGLYWSINTATVSAAYAQDLCGITDVLNRVGMHNAADGSEISPENPSFVLGASNVAPLTMASAFATLADDGTYCRPRAILEVTDTRGNTYAVPPEECEKVADTQHVAELNNTLKAIASERIAQNVSFPIAGPMWSEYMTAVAENYPTEEFTAYDGPASDPRTMGSRRGGETVRVPDRPGPNPSYDPSTVVSTED